MYVLAALEIDKMRKKMLGAGGADGYSNTLDSLLHHDKAVGSDKTLDVGWRGAEAFHFYLLAQRQLFEGNVEAALVTSLRLRQYDDILTTEQVEALIALCAFYSQAFGQCSKAFI